MIDLLRQRCVAKPDAPMTEPDIERHLSQVSGWRYINGEIEKSFPFLNYYETIAFVNAVAWIAHTEDHHPDLRVTYNRCVVRYRTHSVGGISLNDFICAAKIDALVAFIG
jgi:4a-hydroxytetrahydrobiopterin dehydratase